ncbi:MAG: cell envelope biogenesis protein OmpA [Flavobacteriaceae bacterium]|nr:cell envelope biogenesis protein OmpA [Flavobacteriaceae bacterium]
MKQLKPIFFFTILFYSCVSTKTFREVENRYANLKMEYKSILEKNKLLNESNDSIIQLLNSKSKLLEIIGDSLMLVKNDLNDIKLNYETLESKSDSDIKSRIIENNNLLDSLAKIHYELKTGLNKVFELEKLVLEKEKKLNLLRKNLSDALLNFEGNGLKVDQRNGKVYVSMENKLLFKSGSWKVQPDGRKAIKQLSNVLAGNPEINVLIEGHTDNIPYSGEGVIKNNWDLSTKRATAIINLLLINKLVLPQNITAAGRGEFFPIASNSDEKGRSANRRIEVILTPKLNEISKLLENIN